MHKYSYKYQQHIAANAGVAMAAIMIGNAISGKSKDPTLVAKQAMDVAKSLTDQLKEYLGDDE